MLDYDLEKTLKWCVDNDVSFTVTVEDGTVAISAQRKSIRARYVIDPPYNAKNLGESVWSCLFSVKHGTEFHTARGDLPDDLRAPIRPTGGPSPGGPDPVGNPASPTIGPAFSQPAASGIPNDDSAP